MLPWSFKSDLKGTDAMLTPNAAREAETQLRFPSPTGVQSSEVLSRNMSRLERSEEQPDGRKNTKSNPSTPKSRLKESYTHYTFRDI
ncbi:unnamed protein product [Parascedosporium putredinis]|uniref:Uncharacterized protein n=1 Tax=Parascedosporium putredinis TaxID=1442378 RepID=A0A9P1MF86_9PEZI|nr:unnamed protein product [Parascedosporium putredinis]CAI8001943.1 unnamed protein product [Parascedosporium putredinis]